MTLRESIWSRRNSSSAGSKSLAHEAAVAAVQRQFVGQRRVEPNRQVRIAFAESPHGAGEFDGQFATPDKQSGDGPGGVEPGTERREIARTATIEREPRQRASDVRHLLQGQAQVLAQAGIGDEQFDRIMARGDGGRIG